MFMNIHNIPAYAYDYRYIVYRVVDGDRWFWGAWNDRDAALQAAAEVGGEVADATVS